MICGMQFIFYLYADIYISGAHFQRITNNHTENHLKNQLRQNSGKMKTSTPNCVHQVEMCGVSHFQLLTQYFIQMKINAIQSNSKYLIFIYDTAKQPPLTLSLSFSYSLPLIYICTMHKQHSPFAVLPLPQTKQMERVDSR